MQENKSGTFIEFTDEQLDFILKYQEVSESATIQGAILNAVSIALDEVNRQ